MADMTYHARRHCERSEAIQKNSKHGLLRRYTHRNDVKQVCRFQMQALSFFTME